MSIFEEMKKLADKTDKFFMERIDEGIKPNAMTGVEGWEKEFDEQFESCNGGDAITARINDDGLSTGQYIKSFIRTLLTEERERAAKVVEDSQFQICAFECITRTVPYVKCNCSARKSIASRIRKGSSITSLGK